MPEGDVLEPDERVAAHEPSEAADPLGDDRVALVRHRRRALLPGRERLLDLAHLGSREVTDLEREAIERRREDRERGEELGVPVALEDLRRRRCRLEPERLARDPLDLRRRRRVRADGARELADAHPGERVVEPRRDRARAGTPSRAASGRTSSARRGRRASGRWSPCRGAPRRARATASTARSMPSRMSAPAFCTVSESAVSSDVRGGEPEVEPAPVRAQLVATASTNAATSWFVSRSSSATRSGWELVRGRARRVRSPTGTTPTSRPGVEGGELHGEPLLELGLLRPDPGHGRPGVAGDHCGDCSRRPSGHSSSRTRHDSVHHSYRSSD